MFVVGFCAGTFLVKKALTKINFNPPEHFTFDHVQSMQNSQKFQASTQNLIQFEPDKFPNHSKDSSSSSTFPNTVYKSDSNIDLRNKHSPYSSLMTGSFSDKKYN